MGRFEIVFDSPTNAFFAGTAVTGKVHLSLDQPKKVRALSIKFKGVAQVRFTAQEREVVHHHNHHHTSTAHQPHHTGGSRTEHRTVTHTYTAEEEYYSYKYNLEGDGNNETIIPAGIHVYHFSATLPAAIPSSFEGKHGHVQYTVKATLVRPWKFDEHAKAVFEVVSPLDLNYNLKAKESVRIGLDKSFCCFWCRSGPLQLIVSLPYAGFVPGQTIPVTIEVDNASRVDIDNVVVTLNKILEWKARSPSIKQKVDKVELLKLSLDGVQKNGSRSMVQMLTVPNVPPVNLDQCNIINCNFNLMVTALVAGCHKNLVAEVQIFIGTVPLYNSPGLPSSSFAPAMPSAPELAPSAPVGFNVDTNGFDSKIKTPLIPGFNSPVYS